MEKRNGQLKHGQPMKSLLVAFHCRADDGPKFNAGLVTL